MFLFQTYLQEKIEDFRGSLHSIQDNNEVIQFMFQLFVCVFSILAELSNFGYHYI